MFDKSLYKFKLETKGTSELLYIIEIDKNDSFS